MLYILLYALNMTFQIFKNKKILITNICLILDDWPVFFLKTKVIDFLDNLDKDSSH